MAAKHTLVIDIGGTGIKMITLDPAGEPVNERARELTPQPSLPEAVLGVCEQMVAAQPPSQRVSVGFPGVVVHGVVRTAPNLGSEDWAGFPLQERLTAICDRPTRVINDAELQGYGVIDGTGVELVLTLGTGLGTGLYTDGRLVPNLELAHHPWRKGATYEQRISNAERKRIGKGKWRVRVLRMLDQLEPIFNYDVLHLGGGNAKHLFPETLPLNVKVFQNVEGMMGGINLWES